MEKALYDTYLAILKEELVPAMGCTEPIAVAYAAALARRCRRHRGRRCGQGAGSALRRDGG